MHKKCSRCGILNREADVLCYRCQTPLGDSFGAGRRPPRQRDLPNQTDAATQSFNLIRPLIVLVVALGLGLAVYKMIVPAVPEKPLIKAESPNTIILNADPNALDNIPSHAEMERKIAEQMKSQREAMEKNSDVIKRAQDNAIRNAFKK